MTKPTKWQCAQRRLRSAWADNRLEWSGHKDTRYFDLWHIDFAQFFRNIWTASSEFGTYRLCEQRRFRRACASAQSRQNLRCSLIQAVSQEEPSDRKRDPWPLWMAGHAQLKFVMTECSKTQIRLTGLICSCICRSFLFTWRNSAKIQIDLC